MTDPEIYNAYYFANSLGRPYERSDYWLDFFETIADQICRDIAPSSVMDAGCAWGFLVEKLRDRDVEAYGVDISDYAISQVDPSVKEYCRVGSILEPFPRKYDLIVTIEVLEHLEKKDAAAAVRNLCSHTDDILFSSAPDDFRETTHLNVQPPEYWAELFAGEGFYRDVDFDASFVTSWAVRFRRMQDPPHRYVRAYERSMSRLLSETRTLRALNLDLQHELEGKKRALEYIRNSLTYRFAYRLSKLFPFGTRFKDFLKRILRSSERTETP